MMDMDRYIGRLLDNRYEILEAIGTGGMAEVYKARCHRLNRLVAIKILRQEFTQDEEFRRRFHAESQAVAMLSHPNIVSVYDVSTTNDADYIVMELIDGITLKQYMEKKGVLNWKETLHFAIQIAKALEHAHSRGIIHRDIKPHNVMVLKNGSVKVTDFGIARMMSESNTLTKEALGSVHYISPEQAKGGNVDNRSDLYSLGVVMYEMITGRTPYDGETPVAVAIQHINSKATLPSMLNPNIPGGLEQIIMRAMAHSPADRYPSAGAMLADMDEFRKNPAILFDYNNPNTDIDAATRLQPMPLTSERPVSRPRPAPERSAPTPRPAPRRNTATTQKPARRQEVIVEDKEERSKVATVAIVACAVVAFAAIILFCIAFFGEDFLSSSNEMTLVPDLVGQVYEEGKDYGDVVVVISGKQYSNQYAKDVIIKQDKKADKEIAKGSTIQVTVSLGPQPEEKLMVDMFKSPESWAVDFLNDMELDLKIIPKMENSSDVAENCIIRTDPTEGEVLTKGQTVYLWISTGPVRKTSIVPSVVNCSLDLATQLMNGSNFFNVSYEMVDSNEEAGKVIEQNVMAGIKVDVTTQIVLKVSKGPQPTDPVPTDPPEDNYTEQTVTVTLPELEKDCVLTIWVGTEQVDMREVFVGTYAVELKLRGEGLVTFTAMLDNDLTTAWTFEVEFPTKAPDDGGENADE